MSREIRNAIEEITIESEYPIKNDDDVRFQSIKKVTNLLKQKHIQYVNNIKITISVICL